MTCSLCGGAGAQVDAGGDLGLVHRACFVAWDRAAEIFELTGVGPALPDVSLEQDVQIGRAA